MQSGSLQVPERLPLLPLRDVVLFPGVSLPLFIGRVASVAAVEAALEDRGLFFAVTQKRPDLTSPSGRDLFRVGTVAGVREHSRLPDGTLRVVVQGFERARLRRLANRGAYLSGSIEPMGDPCPTDATAEDVAQLRDRVLRAFEEYVSLRDRLTEDVFDTASRLDDSSTLSYFVAGHLAASVRSRQRLLGLEGWLPRLDALADALDADVQILRNERRVRSAARRVREEFSGAPPERKPAPPVGEDVDPDDELAEVRRQVLSSDMPDRVRDRAQRELTRLERMNPMSPEATVSRTYLDWLVAMPWTVRSSDRLDLAVAEEILDGEHFGLRKVKDRILEEIAVLKLSKKMRGPVLCLVGPPGVGKTSLGRSIATALRRQFVRISLGGVRDEAEIRGHRKTYIGSMPGRIVQALRRAGTVNPLILLDEIDKLGADFRGDPAAALLEVLDGEQNHTFHDHYLDVEYDLSSILFVTTANSLSGIPPALLDRMEVVQLPGYLEYEKLAIAKRFLIPRQTEQCGLPSGSVRVEDDALEEIVRHHTRESGVRNLERSIGTICRRVARRHAEELLEPVTVSEDTLSEYLGAARFPTSELIEHSRNGVATGLAWTGAGGVILNVEVVLLPGKGRLLLTGQQGETMRESGQAALSYIRSRSHVFGVDPDFVDHYDIHVHMPQGGVPKDGPSAGVTMALAIVSALTQIPTRSTVALTGEITLRGTVLPVGGLGEKIMAARQSGVKMVLVPQANVPQIQELPDEIVDGIEVVMVSNMDEVLEYSLDGSHENPHALELVPLSASH
jgi:ATP-dependent Lon protease